MENRMTIQQWLNRMTTFAECPSALIKAIWGDDLKDVEEYLLNAKNKEYYEHDIKVFQWEIEKTVSQLNKLKEKIHIPYEEIIREEWGDLYEEEHNLE